jgi:tripartite-type tricarboxylate transporter receptor subunit TctC
VAFFASPTYAFNEAPMSRRIPFALAAFALALSLVGSIGTQSQETWPSRRVTAIVPFPVGQGIDIMAHAS